MQDSLSFTASSRRDSIIALSPTWNLPKLGKNNEKLERSLVMCRAHPDPTILLLHFNSSVVSRVEYVLSKAVAKSSLSFIECFERQTSAICRYLSHLKHTRWWFLTTSLFLQVLLRNYYASSISRDDLVYQTCDISSDFDPLFVSIAFSELSSASLI